MGTQQRTRLPTQIHHVGNESYVDTVEEVAMAVFVFLIGITNTAQIDGTDTAFYQPVDGLFHIVVVEAPIACEVVHHTIGNNSQGNLVAHLFLFCHQAIDGIVQCRVATHDDDGLITIAYQHGYQTLYAVCRLTLNEVILHLALIEDSLDFLALLVTASFGTIKDAPPFVRYFHCLCRLLISQKNQVVCIQYQAHGLR